MSPRASHYVLPDDDSSEPVVDLTAEMMRAAGMNETDIALRLARWRSELPYGDCIGLDPE